MGDEIVKTTEATTTLPAWMQQALFNTIQAGQMWATQPFQPYTAGAAATGLDAAGNMVAGPTSMTQQAWQQAQNMQGGWQPAMNAATQNMSALMQAPGASQTASPYINQQNRLLGGLDYNAPVNTLAPFVQQSMEYNPLAAGAQPLVEAGKYGAGMGDRTSVDNIQDYMNPYVDNVTKEIARIGGRNLEENLLPSTADAFIKAGSFGGTRMGEFGSRAVRDTQEAILGEQRKALMEGYGQALTTSGQDLSRGLQGAQLQANTGQSLGTLAGAQQDALLRGGTALGTAQQNAIAQGISGASQYGQMGQTAGGFANTDLMRQQSATGQLGNLAQSAQQMGMADIGVLGGAGAQQQQNEQNLLDTAYAQWQREQTYPQQNISWMAGLLNGAPNQSSTQTDVNTGTYNPSEWQKVLADIAAVGSIGESTGLTDYLKNWANS